MDLKELAKGLVEKDEKELAREFPLFAELIKLERVKTGNSGVFWVPLPR